MQRLTPRTAHTRIDIDGENNWDDYVFAVKCFINDNFLITLILGLITFFPTDRPFLRSLRVRVRVFRRVEWNFWRNWINSFEYKLRLIANRHLNEEINIQNYSVLVFVH